MLTGITVWLGKTMPSFYGLSYMNTIKPKFYISGYRFPLSPLMLTIHYLLAVLGISRTAGKSTTAGASRSSQSSGFVERWVLWKVSHFKQNRRVGLRRPAIGVVLGRLVHSDISSSPSYTDQTLVPIVHT